MSRPRLNKKLSHQFSLERLACARVVTADQPERTVLVMLALEDAVVELAMELIFRRHSRA
jgi:hypothetical protein